MAVITLKLFRKPALLCLCALDFVWLCINHVTNTRFRRCLLLVAFCTLVLWLAISWNVREVGHYSKWNPRAMLRRQSNTKHFILAPDADIFMYSAIANSHYPLDGAINIIITTLDASRAPLLCCVLLDNTTLFTTPAEYYYFYHTIDVAFISKIMEYFHPEIYFAHQYSCTVPEIGQQASHVTLTSSVCSPDIRDYLPVVHPQQAPGKLGVCAKIAHSGGLDPEKVIEWFEMQRMLGVDKVVIYDMGNPDNITRVFRYYQQLGVLELLPYELPGNPQNRTLMEKDKRTLQFHHDESLAVIECRQRLGGYSFVLSHDLDEFIIPRKDVGLKEFFKEKMQIYQDSAGFYFDAEFFIYNWGPTNPEADLMLTRYRKATKPHWECTKYVYLPSRALSTITHHIIPHRPYTTYKIEADEAVLHHYRRCPDDVWPTCFPETIIDHVMTRFSDLHERVVKVREATNTKPNWNAQK